MRNLLLVSALGLGLGTGVGTAAAEVDAVLDPQATAGTKSAPAAPKTSAKAAPAQVPSAKPATNKPATASTKSATAKPAPGKVTTAKPAAKATTPRRTTATSKSTKGPVPVPSEKEKDKPLSAGRRDPFKVPVWGGAVSQAGEQGIPITGPLPPGTRGLVIGQLLLEGIVRQDTTNTMIAVVANETKRAYFLRENDALYNGVVSKITPDAVYFKENYLDTGGRVASREVVKRMSPAPGEVK